jgi:hypothetical protein
VKFAGTRCKFTMSLDAHEEFRSVRDYFSSSKIMSIVHEDAIVIGLFDVFVKQYSPFKVSHFIVCGDEIT